MLLVQLGEDAVHLQTKFPPDTKDRDWIPAVCRENRIIVTCDKAQVKQRGKTAVELALLKQHRGRAFFLPRAFPEWPGLRQAACFFNCWVVIAGTAPTMKASEFYECFENGRQKQIHLRKP